MLLTKITDAWSELVELEELGELNNDGITLITALNEERVNDSLDNLVAHEFPNGVSIEELTEFFNNEARNICEKIGSSVVKAFDYYKMDYIK